MGGGGVHKTKGLGTLLLCFTVLPALLGRAGWLPGERQVWQV